MQTVADESTLAWYLEVESPGYNSNDIDPFKNPGAAGHYTQVVWAETEEIGCGFTYYNVSSLLTLCYLGQCEFKFVLTGESWSIQRLQAVGCL